MFSRFSQIISFFNPFSRTSTTTSASGGGLEAGGGLTAAKQGQSSLDSIEKAIETLNLKFKEGSRPTSWDLKKLQQIETDIKKLPFSANTEQLLEELNSLSLVAQKASQNAWRISAQASRIFNWSDKPSWESFKLKLEGIVWDLKNSLTSPKKTLGGSKERFQITGSTDSTIAVLSGSTYIGDEEDQLEPEKRNFDSSVSRVLKKQDEIIGGVVASADGWGRASGEYGDKIDQAGMTGCRVLSHYLFSLERPKLLTQELANKIVKQCDEAMISCGAAANLAGVRIFPGEHESFVQIVGVSVGNQRILAVHADTGEVYSLNNEKGDDDSTRKICLGLESDGPDGVKYQEKDVEAINQKIPIPKEKCIVFIATDGAWHNLPKAKDNPSQLDADEIARGVFNYDSSGSLKLTPKKAAECLQKGIEEKSKMIRAEKKALEEKQANLSSLADRIRAVQRLEKALESPDCLSDAINIRGCLSSLAKVQGKPKDENPDLRDFQIPKSWENWLNEEKSDLTQNIGTLKAKIKGALQTAKSGLDEKVKKMKISNFDWGQEPNENPSFRLSEEEEFKLEWCKKALDDATVTVIAPWYDKTVTDDDTVTL